MNYFERLIRRALLEAPARAGEALRDPFENEGPLELETPPSVPASKVPRPMAPLEIPEPQVRIEQTTHVVSQREVSHQETREIVAAPAQETIAPEAPAATSRATPANAPLTQADAFMRGLGVEVPSRSPPARSFPQAEIQPAMETVPHRAELPAVTPSPPYEVREPAPLMQAIPAAITPPPAPRRDPAPTRTANPPSNGARPGTPASRRSAEKTSSPKPVREVVRERIHVVKVVHDGARSATNAGAAPSTFGAAQL